jgi:tetratricopeptide (TPR) repeat protein
MPRIVLLRDPLTPEEHINLGLSYEKNGEYDAALKEYESAAKNMPIGYLYIGNMYFQRGMIEKAEKAYKQAIDNTGDPRAFNNLAWLYYTSGGNLEEAEGLAGKAVELSPDNQEFTDTLTRIIEKRKE